MKEKAEAFIITRNFYRASNVDIFHASEYTVFSRVTSDSTDYAPINIMPHYPPPRLHRGKGGAFDLF